MNWIHAHAAPILGGGGSIAALLVVTFRESLQRVLNGWLEERRLARQAHLAASGKDKDLSNAFIGLLKSDLESQARTRDEMVKSLSALCATSAQLLTGQQEQGVKLEQLNRELLTLKGAVLGRMQ